MADKKSPYDFSNDPYGDARMRIYQDKSLKDKAAAAERRNRNKRSMQDEATQDDPVGNAVRSLWKKVRGQ